MVVLFFSGHPMGIGPLENPIFSAPLPGNQRLVWETTPLYGLKSF